MRSLHSLTSILSLSTLGLGAILGFACSTAAAPSDDDVDVGALTQGELATRALQIMGAPGVPKVPGEQASCSATGCHSINRVTLGAWKQQLDAANAFFADTTKTADERIAFGRQNPTQADTEFTPERIGVMSAGVHLALTSQVTEARTPLTFAQGKMFAKMFEGKDELYNEFREKMLMPVLPDYPRLTPTKYEIVLKWFNDGMPKMKELVPEDRPTTCTEDFAGLKAHASAVKNDNWTAKNLARRMPDFACAPDATSHTACFKQQKDGKDIFPDAESQAFSKGWAQDGSTMRVLRDFTSPNSFWVRTSADGRFVATGGGSGGAQAMDLQATLDGTRRDIGLKASYDPDFFPDNAGFMFQSSTKYCSQSLLEKASTTLVTFNEPECSNLSAAHGLYQTVGQIMGDNNLSDRFILYSIWSGDSGSYAATAKDTPPKAGSDSEINIFTAVADGSDGRYKIAATPKAYKMPYLGDTMMGRSGRIIGSRIACLTPEGKGKTLGYQIDSIINYEEDGSYSFRDAPEKLGTICMVGNKANMSFDERFLATHHYNEPSDYSPTDPQAEGFARSGSADVVVVDFVTGKKVKVARMNPGQFALYAHFRSDGWLYFLVVDNNTHKFYAAASDWAVRQVETTPTP